MQQIEPPSQRIIHDVPPVWDGVNPEKQLAPYLKSLKGWLSTTRAQKTQHGMTILHYAAGDLKAIIDGLDVDELTSADGGMLVYTHIQKEYQEYLDRKLPRVLEEALHSHEGKRHKGESMIQYVTRKKQLIVELEKADSKLTKTFKGYTILRDALLPDSVRNVMESWLQGNYDMDNVNSNLRKLERPIPGTGGSHLTGLTGFQGQDGQPPGTDGQVSGTFWQETETVTFVFMQMSNFVLPEAFDGDVLEQALKDVPNEDIIYVAGDLPIETGTFDEEQAIAICANYTQVRKYLHRKQLGRGYDGHQAMHHGGKQGGGKKGGGKSHPPPPKPFHNNTARPRRINKQYLISRSICARCGKMGHWARECTNPPDAKGAGRGDKSSSTSSGKPGLFYNGPMFPVIYPADYNEQNKDSESAMGALVGYQGQDGKPPGTGIQETHYEAGEDNGKFCSPYTKHISTLNKPLNTNETQITPDHTHSTPPAVHRAEVTDLTTASAESATGNNITCLFITSDHSATDNTDTLETHPVDLV